MFILISQYYTNLLNCNCFLIKFISLVSKSVSYFIVSSSISIPVHFYLRLYPYALYILLFLFISSMLSSLDSHLLFKSCHASSSRKSGQLLLCFEHNLQYCTLFVYTYCHRFLCFCNSYYEHRH